MVLNKLNYKVVTDELIASKIPPRKALSHKGENGRVLIIGGSFLYFGAPVLAALAALRTGIDLVYLAIPKPLVVPARAYSPDLIVVPLPDLKITKGVSNKIIKLIERKKIIVDSVLIGPGVTGIKKEIGILAYKLINLGLKLVLDAGALYPEIVNYVKKSNSIITPHAGEFYRIFNIKLNDDLEDRIKNISSIASEYGLTILQKGKIDIISNGSDVYVNYTGNPGMTVGGTGDVLAGITAALLARGLLSLDAALVAAYVNGKCGENAFVKYGLHFIASDLINEIPNVMRKYDKIID